jgi:hypothetical protein
LATHPDGVQARPDDVRAGHVCWPEWEEFPL